MTREALLNPSTASHDRPSGVHGRLTASPVRIALVRQKYRMDGGGERFVNVLMSALRQQGHKVTLITRSWDGDSTSVIQCDPPRIGRALRDWLFARAVTREVGHHQFDLVQSHERIPGCQVYRAGDGVHREWLRQRKRVFSPLRRLWLDVSPFHVYMKHAERLLFEDERLRLVICNSRMVMQEIVENFRIDAKKLRLVYNAVDTERFHPRLRSQRMDVRAELGISDEEPVFIFVGSGFERKGLMQTITSLARLPAGHLVVVGKNKHAGPYLRRAARYGVAGRVHMVGVQRDVERWYGAADALVLPTLYDPFPNVALEAMAAGLPVVSSTKSGAAELIQDGSNGYVCDALDCDALAQAMRHLSNRAHCERLGAEARRTVEPLTPQAMGDRLMKLYTELLNDQS